MKKLLVLFIMTIVIIVGGCSTTNQSKTTVNTENVEGSYANVDVNEAKKLIEKEIIVVDVRTPGEFAEGHIPNAILIPLQEIENRIDEFNPEKQYLIVCRSGNRSGQASEILAQKGLKHIYNMTGGMNEWSGEVATE